MVIVSFVRPLERELGYTLEIRKMCVVDFKHPLLQASI